MNTTLQNIIGDAAYLARTTFAEYGRIAALDSQYTDHAAEFTQEEIDSVPKLLEAQLTPTELANTVYALKMIKFQIDDVAFDAFIKIAKL